MIVFRYVARHFASALVASLVGLCTVFLIVDFADRAKFYSGDGWFGAVVELYLCKLATTAHQLGPAALALGAAIGVSALRKRGEVTALRALGRGPWTFALPVAVVAALFGTTMFFAEDPIVVPASYRAEAITALKFHKWGDWKDYHHDKRWYRGESGIIYDLGRMETEGFSNVTVYELDPDFRLVRRIDTPRLRPGADGAWVLENAVFRSFTPDGAMHERYEHLANERFPDDLDEFRVKTGRPSQLRRRELPAQIAARQKLGLPSLEWELALQERRAYHLMGVPVAVLGAGLALRRNRKGHLTTAIAEGFGVTLGLWAMTALAKTLTLSGHLSTVVGGWLPFVVACLACAWAMRVAR